MVKSWCIRNRYIILFLTFLIAFYGYNINRIFGFVFFPDEFGYWAYAAALSGFDWSDITAMGSYYSYGYSLILFPIFKLFSNAIIAYRVAVTVNFILIGIDYFLLFHLIKKMNVIADKEILPVLSGIAVFYPANLFYAKTTMVETVLMSVFILICVLLYDYLENNKLSWLIALIVAIVYIHFLHMRAVGVSISVGITLLAFFTNNSKKVKHFLWMVLIGTICVTAGIFIKKWAQGAIYTATDIDTININDYAGQVDKIRYIFTLKGAKDFAYSLAGKILYLGISSFGLFYFGIAFCLKECMDFLHTKGERDVRKLFFLFLLLTAIGEIGINAIYNVKPIRVDSVVYGRYDEFILPIFIVLGIIEFIRVGQKVYCMSFILLANAGMTYVTIIQNQKYELTNIHGYVMVGMSYLYSLFQYEACKFFWLTYVVSSIGMILILCIIWFAYKKKSSYLLFLLVLLEFLLFTRASQIYIDSTSLGAYRDSILCEKIEGLVLDDNTRRVIYLDEDEDPFISSIQFIMRNTDIEVLRAKQSLKEYTNVEMDDNDIILIMYDSDYGEILKDKYQNTFLYGKFQMYYN